MVSEPGLIWDIFGIEINTLNMEIKAGQKFRCIKDVVMDNGDVEYRKGLIYTSANDGCITDDSGDVGHMWYDDIETWEHFELYEPDGNEAEDIAEAKEPSFQTIADAAVKLLEYKNKHYGNSALNPIEVFNGKSKVGQRADDKLSRIKNSPILRKADVIDLLGYLILMCKENNWSDFSEFED